MKSTPRRPLALLLVCALAGSALTCAEEPPAPKGPAPTPLARLAGSIETGGAASFDVVVVTIDTLRADRVGCYGAGPRATPTIDRLARRGVRFERAMASAPITLPSHATLFTGLWPPNHGVRNNGTFRLAAERTTLAERLSAAGYRTSAAIGALVLDSRFGLDQGFATYDDAIAPADGAATAHFDERPAGAVIDAAIRGYEAALKDDPEAPVFVWAHLFDPHFPYAPPADFSAEGDAASLYAGEIRYADRELGRLVAAVESRGRLDRTLFVVTADHGESLGEHGEEFHGFFTYDATIRIPMVLSSTALFSEETVVADEVVGLVDVMPTLLDLLGLAPEPGTDGRALFGAGAPPSDRGIYSEAMLPLLNHGWSSLHALRRADDRYIRAPEPEYYDLARDPAETKNLADDLPARGRSARDRLEELMKSWGDVEAVAKEEMPLDPELAQRLAALGYGRVARAGGAGEREDPKRMLRLYAKSKSAKARLDAGEAEAALEEIKIVLRGDPENADAWITAARANLRLQRWEESEQCARRAVTLSDTAYPHHLLGQLLLRSRRFDEGRAELRLALDRDPGYGGAWISIGESHAMERRWDEARRCFERAREVDPAGSGAAAARAIERLDALLRGR